MGCFRLWDVALYVTKRRQPKGERTQKDEQKHVVQPFKDRVADSCRSLVLMTVYENRPVLVSGTMNALHLGDGNKNRGAAAKQ
jgi:hypothetical protein